MAQGEVDAISATNVMKKIKQLIRSFNRWRWHGDGSDPRYLGTKREKAQRPIQINKRNIMDWKWLVIILSAAILGSAIGIYFGLLSVEV